MTFSSANKNTAKQKYVLGTKSINNATSVEEIEKALTDAKEQLNALAENPVATEPTEDSTKPTEDATKPTEDTTKPTEDSTKPTNKPTTPSNGSGSGSPKTGDAFNMLWVLVLVVSGAAVVVMLIADKKNKIGRYEK